MLKLPSNLFDVKNKNAVITGASSGIGLALSQTLAAAGANVVMVARRGDVLETQAEEISQSGGAVRWVDVDLLNRDQTMASYGRIDGCFGAPSIVINAAGVNLRQSADEISFEKWDDTLNLNLTMPFFFSRLFVEDMKQANWGRIINIASLQSYRAFQNGLAYGASKGGIVQLTRAMAESWSSFGIMCNAIGPGFFKTQLTASVFDDDETVKKLANCTAIGRNGTMEDLQGPVLFFASRASDYVTGQVLFVDGGFTAK